ncbi:hypothetical protein ACP3WW_23115, partial [Salmonella enterica]
MNSSTAFKAMGVCSQKTKSQWFFYSWGPDLVTNNVPFCIREVSKIWQNASLSKRKNPDFKSVPALSVRERARPPKLNFSAWRG